jgi:signal transduction histidine kinase
VVVNLILNARDAMPRDGSLVIQTANVQCGDAPSAPGVSLAHGRYVTLSVRDTGVGMDEATRARIFEPFFTTKEEGRGTGLGLSSAYGTITGENGHIFVESGPARGRLSQSTCRRVPPRPARLTSSGPPGASSPFGSSAPATARHEPSRTSRTRLIGSAICSV